MTGLGQLLFGCDTNLLNALQVFIEFNLVAASSRSMTYLWHAL